MLSWIGRIDPVQREVFMKGRVQDLTLPFPSRTRDDGADHGIALARETRWMQ